MHDFPALHAMIRVSRVLSDRGWAEANAGNMSMRVDRSEIDGLVLTCGLSDMEKPFPELNGDWFLVTSTKSRARDMERITARTIGLIEITSEGTKIQCHWGASPQTSEFPAHLSIYKACKEKNPEINAVLHTHPPNLIAMTHLPDLQEPGKLNTALRSMHPEVPILVPGGVTEMDFKIPGSFELGLATGDAVCGSRVAVWQMHGIVSVAEDIERALDQVEIIEKAATIYMLVRSTGNHPVGLSDEQIRTSREYWGIKGELD